MKSLNAVCILFLLASLASAGLTATRASAEENALKNESEVGLVIISGNARSESYNLKQADSYEWTGNVLRFGGRFLKTSSTGVESARSWNLGLRYERILSDKVNVFVGQDVESDIFAGYRQRYNTDAGVKYSLYKTDDFNWIGELGYRYTIENRVTPPDLKDHHVRAYTETNHKWNKDVSSRFWLEYLPNLTNSTDWQLNGEYSISAVMTSIFSIKTAYLVKYDHQPAPGVTETSDRSFTTSLVAKF